MSLPTPPARTHQPEPAPGDPIAPTRIDHLVRADDQLRLTCEFLNLDVSTDRRTLVQVDRTEPFTGVRLIFGSQHTVEQTIGAEDATPSAGVDFRTARDSRLVFELPPGTPYALASILELAAHALRLDPRAAPGAGASRSGEPAADVTALELVDSLIFTPLPEGRFTAAVKPISRDGVTELWRARLAPSSTQPEAPPGLRAIFSRPGDPPFDRPLNEADRTLILSATLTTPAEPVVVERLWLTSQGCFLDVRGSWTGELATYLHRITAGRDLHVEVVRRGYLAPFGHQATITTVTDRQFRRGRDGTTAVLVTDDYLAVAAPVLSFPAPQMPDKGRAFPFPEVRIADVGSGPVGKRALVLADGSSISTDNAWAVTRDGADVLISYAATDRTGRTGITFDLPAIFVSEAHAFTVQDEINGVATPLGNLADVFASAPAELVEADLRGQPVGWANPHPRGRAGSTRMTTSIRFQLDRPVLGSTPPAELRAELEAAGRPAFYPRVVRASVVDEATAALLGDPLAAIEVRYADAWLEHGNGPANPGLAFLRLQTARSIERPGAGEGLLRPAFTVDTYSQVLGSGIELPLVQNLVGDEPKARWDPGVALGEAAKLFGIILLRDIVEAVEVAVDDLPQAAGLPTFEVLVEDEGIGYELTWEPTLKTFRLSGEPVLVISADLAEAGLPDFFAGKPSTAKLEVSQLVRFDGASGGGADVELRLENVALRLPPGLPAVAIGFRSVSYADPAGGTARLDTDLASWLFINVLSFLEPIREAVVSIADLGDIEIGPDGVKADVEIPVPELGLGVIAVTGLSVGLSLDLPNEGSATIGFHLSTSDDPFRITFMGFGGSGFFELELVADDITVLHGSLAVTYELSVSLIVVSASLSASLGLELTYEDEQVSLTAFVEITGNASVLGLLNLTGKVLLALRYTFTTEILTGTATVSAEVESPFGRSEISWQETVTVALGSGSAADRSALRAAEGEASPAFGDRFSTAQWTDYCAAFH